MKAKRFRALGLAAALVGWSFTAGIDRPWRRHPVAQAAVGTLLALVAGAPLGLTAPAARGGLRWGGGRRRRRCGGGRGDGASAGSRRDGRS